MFEDIAEIDHWMSVARSRNKVMAAEGYYKSVRFICLETNLTLHKNSPS